ncbi:hypothetical protein SFRURICE_009231 [Spodoptera frugiperda]|nr:hypothetical protein SFRURICE_009231 [Spodoptera frugiperda]
MVHISHGGVVTDEQYYEMPRLFALDEWPGCVAARGAYCVGSFELAPAQLPHPLYDLMQAYSANSVDNYNHTRLHRGLCLPRSCAAHAPPRPHDLHEDQLRDWFSSCVNASTLSGYNLSAQLLRLEYCTRGEAPPPDLTPAERAFAGFLAALLALAVISTALDLTLSDHARKGADDVTTCPYQTLTARAVCGAGLEWALVWSVPACWRALSAPPGCSLSFVCSRGESVVLGCCGGRSFGRVGLASRRTPGRLWSFHGGLCVGARRAVWWVASGVEYLRSGRAECSGLARSSECWQQDMQLWTAGVAWRVSAAGRCGGVRGRSAGLWCGVTNDRRGVAVFGLVGLLIRVLPGLTTAGIFRSVWLAYREEPSFNVLYQSPLGNVPGALAGLLLAHLHHALLDLDVQLPRYKDLMMHSSCFEEVCCVLQIFGWLSVAAVPVAAWWVAVSPLALGRGPPARLPAAALAALERPVFSFFVAMALLGAMNGIPSAVKRCLSWPGWAAWARLSFGALLLHMPINKSLVAARLMPSMLDRQAAISEWFGVAAVSYMAALPLALLVELPAQRLVRALRPERAARAPSAPPARAPADKSDL